MGRKLRALGRIAGFLLLIIVFLVPMLLAILLGLGEWHNRLLQRFYGLGASLWAVRIRQQGSISTARPLLVVSNHSSYLDIPVMGQAGPLKFTPKSEIRHWPLIGWLCVMAGCVFIERRRDKTPEARKKLEAVLRQGNVISLFPEGSTNDGAYLKHFHTSFFSLAEIAIDGELLQVQPVSIVYSKPDGIPLTRAEMDKVAWYDEMTFVPHLWEFLQTEGVLATVICHAPVTIAETDGDRKALAKYCEGVIAEATGLEVKQISKDAVIS